MTVPQSTPGAATDPNAATNVLLSIRSVLLSVAETNFSRAEFEIPEGYKDLTGQPQPLFQPGPEIFGSKTIGEKNLEGLRKDFEEGKPILNPIGPKTRP